MSNRHLSAALANTFPRTFNLKQLGEYINVPFATAPLEEPILLWVNERWFLQNGCNILDHEVRHAIEKLILEVFAVSSDAGSNSEYSSYFAADRYGGTGGAIHGGSGRCGNFGGYNAKGIGQTPLVSPSADLFHSNGKMSVAEAIREAINAEIAHYELPHGSVPVIAIIATGNTFSFENDPAVHRGAIVIRPNVVRPAHFERSIFFGDSGYIGSDQYIDNLRVRDAVKFSTSDASLLPSFSEMFYKISYQIGAARALRLWQGQLLSSNLSVNGEFLDFGSFRAVPNWCGTFGLAEERFGSEMKQLRNIFLSIAFSFVKFGGAAIEAMDLESVIRKCNDIENASFLHTCLDRLGVYDRGKYVACLEEALLEYYHLQQKSRLADNVRERKNWLFNTFLSKSWSDEFSIKEEVVASRIRRLYEGDICSYYKNTASMEKARNFLRPSRQLHHSASVLASSIFERFIFNGKIDVRHAVASYIGQRIRLARRTWKNLPKHFAVVKCLTSSDAVRCLDMSNGQLCTWTELDMIDDRVALKGNLSDITVFSKPHSIGKNWVGYVTNFEG